MKELLKLNSKENVAHRLDAKIGYYLISGCHHVPFVNIEFLKQYCNLMKDLNDVGLLRGNLLIGDFLDMHSVSRHNKGKIKIPNLTLGKEYAAGNEVLDMFDSVAPDIDKLYIFGNHECYADDVEILTVDGWINGVDYVTKHNFKVATYNIEKDIIEYQDVDRRILKYRQGKMHHYSSTGVDLLVTPKHNILYKGRDSKQFSLVKSEEININRIEFKTCGLLERFNYCTDISEDEIKLTAWLMTDRSIDNSYCIYQSKPENVKEIRELLIRLNIKFTETSRERKKYNLHIKNAQPQYSFYISKKHRPLINKLLPSGKCIIPNWVKQLSKEKFEIFLDTLIQGDGSIHRSSEYSQMLYGVKSFLDQVSELCTLNNIRNSLSNYRESHWRLNIARQRNSISFDRNKRFSEVNYSGLVWCVSVPNETVIVRRNGKISIQGNCWYSHYMSEIDNAKIGTEVIKSPKEALHLDTRGYVVLEDFINAEATLGDLTLIHGTWTCKHSAYKHLTELKRNVIFVHTHRQNVWKESSYESHNIGWMGNANSPAFSYMTKQQKESWRNGFAVVYVDEDYKTHVTQIDWKNNKFIFGGKVYCSS